MPSEFPGNPVAKTHALILTHDLGLIPGQNIKIPQAGYGHKIKQTNKANKKQKEKKLECLKNSSLGKS